VKKSYFSWGWWIRFWLVQIFGEVSLALIDECEERRGKRCERRLRTPDFAADCDTEDIPCEGVETDFDCASTCRMFLGEHSEEAGIESEIGHGKEKLRSFIEGFGEVVEDGREPVIRHGFARDFRDDVLFSAPRDGRHTPLGWREYWCRWWYIAADIREERIGEARARTAFVGCEFPVTDDIASRNGVFAPQSRDDAPECCELLGGRVFHIEVTGQANAKAFEIHLGFLAVRPDYGFVATSFEQTTRLNEVVVADPAPAFIGVVAVYRVELFTISSPRDGGVVHEDVRGFVSGHKKEG
jgi:hypothetical protein